VLADAALAPLLEQTGTPDVEAAFLFLVDRANARSDEGLHRHAKDGEVA